MRIVIGFVLVLYHALLQADDVGRSVYALVCQRCHSPKYAAAIGAPAAGDEEAWRPRLKRAAIESKHHPDEFKRPMDYLLYKVRKGKGLMPHGGLCRETGVSQHNCSDEAYVQAIGYMSGLSPLDR